MAVRQDWTRLTQTIHDFLLPPHFDTRKEFRIHETAAIPTLQFAAGNVAVTQNRNLLAEIERRKGQVIVNNLHNQMR